MCPAVEWSAQKQGNDSKGMIECKGGYKSPFC